MGYVVQTGTNAMGAVMVDRIPKATNAVVEDGHLLLKLDTRNIAIYSPQQWQRVFRDSEVTSGYHASEDAFTSETPQKE